MDVPHIAHRQAGAFTRRQASDEGVSRHATRRRLLSGRWVLLLGEVLVARETLVTPTTRAWAAHLATGGVVSHHTAARCTDWSRTTAPCTSRRERTCTR